MEASRYEAVGALIKRYREASGLLQASVAELLSAEVGRHIHQSLVSKNEKGQGWQKRGDGVDAPDLMRAYCAVLSIPQDEMIEALGFHVAQEDRDHSPPSIADVIQADPSLSKAAKEHLVNQYRLLQLASREERRGRPMLRAKEGNSAR